MNQQPIWYDSTETGSPTLTTGEGSFIELIASCLVNGFNIKPITGISVASGVATVTCASHGYSSNYGKLVAISGASHALLNGNKQPTSTGTNTFTFAAPGVPDGAYTATDARRAPAGWGIDFRNSTAMGLRPLSLEANDDLLLVFVESGVSTTLKAYMRLISNPSERSPNTNRFLASGYDWRKVGTLQPAPWSIVADDLGFYFSFCFSSTSGLTTRMHTQFAGYPTRFAPAHTYGMVLTGHDAANSSSGDLTGHAGDVGVSALSAPSVNDVRPRAVVFRPYTGVAPDHPLGITGSLCSSTVSVPSGVSGYRSGFQTYPNPGNSALFTCPVLLHGPGYVLGALPGLLHMPQRVFNNVIPNLVPLDGIGDHAGKTFLAIGTGQQSNASSDQGCMLIDLTGPWAH